MMRETSGLIEECGDGSSPSEAHCGEWKDLGNDEGGTVAVTDYTFIINLNYS
ncbi:MAG: hypothetical protein U9O50_05570 [Acidobacteriota bacterium]|nr:hypothetical protein [Acidobacteriota bacterium]